MLTSLIALASIASWVYIVVTVSKVYNFTVRKNIELQHTTAMFGK